MAATSGLFIARDTLGNGTTPKGARLALGGLLAGNGASPLDVRKGVLADNGGSVVSGTAGMSYSVRAARFVTAMSAANGPTVLANDAVVVVTTTAAPGSNSRIDVIWVRQHMVSGDGGTDTDTIGQIGVTQGAVAASPIAPAIPAGALALAQAIVTAGATATNTLTFTQVHAWTVANGGIIPGYGGLPTFFNGTVWQPLGRSASGTGTILTVAAANASVAVVFTTPFTTAPKISCEALTGFPLAFPMSHDAATVTGFTAYMYRASGSGNVSFDWTAIQSGA